MPYDSRYEIIIPLREWALYAPSSVPRMDLFRISTPKSSSGLDELEVLANAFISKLQGRGGEPLPRF